MQRSGPLVWTQADYMIGDATLNLDTWFRRSFKKRNKEPGYWDGAGALQHFDSEKQSLSAMVTEFIGGLVASSKDGSAIGEPDPEVEHSKLWVPLETAEGENAGRLLCSFQLMPGTLTEKYEAGDGRDEPNSNPTLPKPVGRPFFTLNPFSLMFQFLGNTPRGGSNPRAASLPARPLMRRSSPRVHRAEELPQAAVLLPPDLLLHHLHRPRLLRRARRHRQHRRLALHRMSDTAVAARCHAAGKGAAPVLWACACGMCCHVV